MSSDVQNINIVGSPQSRILHLAGDVEKSIVTFLIDRIISINEEEVYMDMQYKAKTNEVLKNFDIVKLVESDTGRVGLVAKRNPVEPIELHINSGGGSLSDGMALINIIKTSDVPVIAIVSNASSMATIIALACDRILTYEDTEFMIHELAYGQMGKLRTHKREVESSTRIQNKIDKIIIANSEIPMEDLQKHYDSGDDWFIYGDDIRDYGMTNEIIEYNGNRDTTFVSGYDD